MSGMEVGMEVIPIMITRYYALNLHAVFPRELWNGAVWKHHAGKVREHYTGISHFRTGNQSEIYTDEKDTDIRKSGIYISYILLRLGLIGWI